MSLESSLSTRTRSSDSMLVIFVLVGLPLVVAVFCLLYAAPWAGKAAGLPNGAAHQHRGVSGSGESAMGTEASLAPPQASALGHSSAPPPRPVLMRCDSVSSASSIRPATRRTCDVGTLCPALIVPKASGVTLTITGDLSSAQQECVVNVAAVDITTETILRLLISESGNHKAILIESVLKIPIAIMDTGAAGADVPAENRYVIVRRDMDPTHAPFAIIQADSSTGFKATRGTPDGSVGERLLSVLFDNRNARANVVGADGKLIASVETRSDSRNRVQRVVNISQNADAALVLCSIVASVKLS